ncbi:MAG: hypothetical protein AB8B83_04325 [Bdellovibrionales bacterium]
MTTQFTKDDISFLKFTPIGGQSLAALILLDNGWALDIAQDNVQRERLSPQDCTFTCHLLKPFDGPKLATQSCRELEGFDFDYRKGRMSLDDVVKTLNRMATLDSPSEHTAKEILRTTHRKNPYGKWRYTPTQLGKQPVHWGSGAHLNTQKILEMAREGQFRDPHDSDSPHQYEPFRNHELELRINSAPNPEDRHEYATLLLETGHALYIEMIGQPNEDNPDINYKVAFLSPNERGILEVTDLPDLGDLLDGFESYAPNPDNIDDYDITTVINALLRDGPVLPRHRLEQIIAINAQQPEAQFSISQFNRVQFDELSGRPLGILVDGKTGWEAPRTG